MSGYTLTDNNFSLVDMLLEGQSKLETPVTKISDYYDQDYKVKQFKHLIPLSKPSENEQYAFQVDLDKCTGCKSCVAACHSLNGLDETESWRDTGRLLALTPYGESQQQTVTSACHHCDDPACLLGCPVAAYEKDPLTGIVKHLDDQCIGCQYCVLKCPYDVPKYNKKLGIVRKCDMCQQRLSKGEAPACVQSCPNEAISIVNVSTADIQRNATEQFLPEAPEPSYTKPATQYIGGKLGAKTVVAADKYELNKEHAHYPLLFMLILTQFSAGLTVIAATIKFTEPINNILFIVALLSCIGGIGFSTLHLGQPLKAWKAFLGLPTSWMSREIIAITTYMIVLGGIVANNKLHLFSNHRIIDVLNYVAALFGLVSVFCSAMLYQDTRRRLWNYQFVMPKFFGTSVLLAVYFILGVVLISQKSLYAIPAIFYYTLIFTGTGKLLLSVSLLSAATKKKYTAQKRAYLLIKKELRALFTVSNIVWLFAGILLPLFLISGLSISVGLAAICFISMLIAEISERYLFFVTVDAPKMPGN